MKKSCSDKTKIVKGMSSAVLLSILIHAALFMLAGMLVVFTVVRKGEQRFEPPKAVERPKMKLKKPKVKVRKTSRPKSTQRIVTTMNRAGMPDIQLPEMSGIGEGFDGALGGFDLLPDLSEPTLFGQEQSIGNDLVGTFYDFKRDCSGRNIPYSEDEYLASLKTFVQEGWKESELSRYYRSARKLYATTVMVPPIFSVLAPEAFGEPETGGWCWAIHYKGQLVHNDGIRFRFWGMGDDVLVVAVNGKTVLSACWPDWRGINMSHVITPCWQSASSDSRKYFYGQNKAEVGDWITLEPGVPQDIDIIMGEVPGGHFVSMLAVEVEGVEYEKGPQGNPILPIFKTARPSLDLIETIYEDLVPGEVCVTNGPVFCDYDVSESAVTSRALEPARRPVFQESIENEMREWSSGDGRTFEAKFVVVISDKAVLTDAHQKQRKIPLSMLCDADRLYIELAPPPEFNIDFIKKTGQRFFKLNPAYEADPRWVPRQVDYVFSARLEQVSTGKYNHELNVEFFAVGKEIVGDNYILLDRQESRFTPSVENGRSHKFSGAKVALRENNVFTEKRGQKYGGYLVLVTDSRGVIIDYGTSHKWLLEIVNNLRRIPVGRHFNKAGARVCPPRPKPIGVY